MAFTAFVQEEEIFEFSLWTT